jgi:hypothetical protein
MADSPSLSTVNLVSAIEDWVGHRALGLRVDPVLVRGSLLRHLAAAGFVVVRAEGIEHGAQLEPVGYRKPGGYFGKTLPGQPVFVVREVGS